MNSRLFADILVDMEKAVSLMVDRLDPLTADLQRIRLELVSLEQDINDIRRIVFTDRNIKPNSKKEILSVLLYVLRKKLKNNLDDLLRDFVKLYNSAMDSPIKEEQFNNQFKPERFGVANAMMRVTNSDSKPIFMPMDSGDYYLINYNEIYVIVPRLGLVINDVIYVTEALGAIFNCPMYNPKEVYKNVKVSRPAVFKQVEREWKCFLTGELILR